MVLVGKEDKNNEQVTEFKELLQTFSSQYNDNINSGVIDVLVNSDRVYYLEDYIDCQLVSELLNCDSDNSYPIEKYFDNEEVMKIIMQNIENPKAIIDVCIHCNRLDVLRWANEDILLFPYDENQLIIDYLLAKNIIPYCLNGIINNESFITHLREKKQYKYLLNVSNCTLLEKNKEGITLLEELLNNNLIKKFDIGISDVEIIRILNKRNQLNLINSCDVYLLFQNTDEIFLEGTFDRGISLAEYFLEKGVEFSSPQLWLTNVSKKYEPIINRLYNKGYYEFLGIILYGEQFLIKLDDGTVLLDKLLEKNVFINLGSIIYSTKIAELLVKYKRFDLLIKCDLDILLNEELDGQSYLEMILDAIKSKEFRCDRNFFNIPNWWSNHQIAKFYITFAKKETIAYLKSLEVTQLLKKEIDKTLLDELLELDSDLTLNTILSQSVKANMKIAIILKSRGFDITDIDVPLYEESNTNEYLIRFQNTLGIGPLREEGEILLEELYGLFINDKKSDPQLISSLIIGYRNALLVNYDYTILELRVLIEIKKNNNEFAYYYSNDTIDHFSRSVYCERPIVTVLMHETAHAIHYYQTGFQIPDNYMQIVINVRSKPNFIEKIKVFAEIFNSIIKRVKEIAKEKFALFNPSFYSQEFTDSIKTFLDKTYEEKKAEFASLSISEETLDSILSYIFTAQEYKKQFRRIKTLEYEWCIKCEELELYGAFCDILDAICEGEFNNGLLKSRTGKAIPSCCGHGVNYYYDRPNSMFIEMIANYAVIIKSKNSSQMIGWLRHIVGNELVDMLDEFYVNELLNSKEEKENTNNL